LPINRGGGSRFILKSLTTKSDPAASLVIDLLHPFGALIELSKNAILIHTPGHITTLPVRKVSCGEFHWHENKTAEQGAGQCRKSRCQGQLSGSVAKPDNNTASLATRTVSSKPKRTFAINGSDSGFSDRRFMLDEPAFGFWFASPQSSSIAPSRGTP
jgi:hypothetical protein